MKDCEFNKKKFIMKGFKCCLLKYPYGDSHQLHYFGQSFIPLNKQTTSSRLNVRLSIENRPKISAIAQRNFVNSRLICQN